MRKLSSIQEGMWRSVVTRSNGDEQRKEDDLGVDELTPLDFGLSVFWADKDLKRPLSIKEITEIKFLDGWRLPTRGEAAELCNVIDSYGDYKPYSLGVGYKVHNEYINFDIFNRHYRCWTSTKRKNGYWVFDIPLRHLLPEITVIFEDEELPVRLVKEKV